MILDLIDGINLLDVHISAADLCTLISLILLAIHKWLCTSSREQYYP